MFKSKVGRWNDFTGRIQVFITCQSYTNGFGVLAIDYSDDDDDDDDTIF